MVKISLKYQNLVIQGGFFRHTPKAKQKLYLVCKVIYHAKLQGRDADVCTNATN